MIVSSPAQVLRAGLFAFAVVASMIPAAAQQASPNAILLAREIITAKGASKLYEPVISEVVDRAKGVLLQTNPMLSRDLNEVAEKMKSEFAPRVAEILNEVAKMYASRFTEAELKDVLAFYKSPVGQKMQAQEPKAINTSLQYMRDWSQKFGDDVFAKFHDEMKKRGKPIT